MKLSDIKTLDQAYEVADLWYQRTFKLKCIWDNKYEPSNRRIKAFALWNMMRDRVVTISNAIYKIKHGSKLIPYEQGGITYKSDRMDTNF